jgi:hypothetical protein
MDNNRLNKKRGRPVINLNWPTTIFTVKDVMNGILGEQFLSSPLTGAAVRMKVRDAVKTGELVSVGKEKGKMGRPRSMFKKVK